MKQKKKYYEKIEFLPTMEIDGYSNTPIEKRFKRVAWVEHVACAILNHLKEDCCIRVSKILDLLVEAGRIDLLPGDQIDKCIDDIETRRLAGAASKRLKIAFNDCDHLYVSQVGIILHSEKIPLDAGGVYKAAFYHFMLHPDDIEKMQRLGKLPGGDAGNNKEV